jgi:mono/diheme cytochrome c family protein
MPIETTNLRRRVCVAAAAAVSLATGCARTLADDPTGPEAQSDEDGPPRRHMGRLFADNCARCHGVDAQGTERAPRLVGEGALARFATAQDVYDFAGTHMPQDAPGFLSEWQYWAIIEMMLRADGVELDAPLGPDNAGSVRLHANTKGAGPARSE